MYKLSNILRDNLKCGVLFVVISLGLVLSLCEKTMAQQEPQFSQYMFNRLSYNPGYAGSNGAICFTGFYRSQWMGITFTDAMGQNTGASGGETMNLSFDMRSQDL